MTAVFSTNPVFVYGLSLFVLNEKADSPRLAAAALAACGVVLTALAARVNGDDGNDNNNNNNNDDDDDAKSSGQSTGAAGCWLALGSALLAAL